MVTPSSAVTDRKGGAEPPQFQAPGEPDDDLDEGEDKPEGGPATKAGTDDGPDSDVETDTVDYWKARSRQWERRNKDAVRARKAAEAKAAELEGASKKPEDAPDAEQIRKQAKKEARAEALRDRVGDRIEALAAKTFNDPADARAFLSSKTEDFIDGEEIDSDAIKEALAELLTEKDYLARGAKKQRFTGTGDNGPRGTGQPKDLDTRIREAEKAGDVALYIRLQNQKLAAASTKAN